MLFAALVLPIALAMGATIPIVAVPAAAYLLTPSAPTKSELIQSSDVTPPAAQTLGCNVEEVSYGTIKEYGYWQTARGYAAKSVWSNSTDNTVPDAATYKYNVNWRQGVTLYDRAGEHPKVQADWVGNYSDHTNLRVCTLTPR